MGWCCSSCRYFHGGPTLYGQSLFAFVSGITKLVPTTGTAFMSWSMQMAYFIYDTCAAGQLCGEYTQLVWSESTTLGYAYKKCNINSPWVMKPVWHIIVCNYRPPGYWVGEWPYEAVEENVNTKETNTAIISELY